MAASSRLGVLMKLDKNQRKPRIFKASDLCTYNNTIVDAPDNACCFHKLLLQCLSFCAGSKAIVCIRRRNMQVRNTTGHANRSCFVYRNFVEIMAGGVGYFTPFIVRLMRPRFWSTSRTATLTTSPTETTSDGCLMNLLLTCEICTSPS